MSNCNLYRISITSAGTTEREAIEIAAKDIMLGYGLVEMLDERSGKFITVSEGYS